MAYFGGSFADSERGMLVQETLSGFTLSGDFYMEPNDITRGVTLDIFDSSLHLQHDSKFLTQSFVYEGSQTSSSWLFSGTATVGTSMSPFREEDDAPTLPVDELFQLERTTIPVQGMSAAQTANSVMNFVNDSAASVIIKVNQRKFTIKAEIIVDRLLWEVKARVYRQASRQYCVEVQRRSGDAFAFNRWYQCLFQHMNLCIDGMDSKLASASAMCSGEGIFLETPSWDGADLETSVDPLLTIVESSNDRKLQSEAVLALAQAAQSIEIAAQLCSLQVVSLLHSLTEVVCFSIMEPLSRLASCLATLPQAKALPELQHLRYVLESTTIN
jgi:hypothetical protein